MNEEKKALKAEKKRIESINNSLKYFSAPIQNELGALAIQQEDNIFFCGNNIYKKIYIVRPAFIKEKKNMFLRTISQLFTNRIRLSLCVNNKSNSLNGSMFMTVFFDCDTYYDALLEVKQFEKEYKNKITRILGIDISCCKLEQLLGFIHMNITGEIKAMNKIDLYGKKSRYDMFDKFSDAKGGFFKNGEKYGLALVGKYFPSVGNDFTDFLKQNEASYQIIFDFQAISEEDEKLFKLLLEEKYNSKFKDDDRDLFINLTYTIITQTQDYEEIKRINKEAFRFFDTNKIVIMPGMNREKEIFCSSCTLGLRDFHIMQNTKLDIASNLIL